MKKTFLIISWLPLFFNAHSQSSLDFINNNQIKFSNRLITPSLLDKVNMPSQYIIRVELSKDQRDEVKKLKKDDWILLLNNKNTDWAANLILYDLYRRDATLIYSSAWKSRSDWILLFKKDDITYWKKYLK